MSKGKGVKRKRGDILRERFLPQGKQPEQTAEELANAFADKVAEQIRDAFAQTIQPGGHLKQEMVDELIKRARSLAYSVALRKASSPKNKTKSTGRDEEAIKEIGKWLVEVKGLRGAPLRKQELWIKALEKRLSGLGWMDVTKKICDCGKSEHNHKCKGRIREGAGRLVSVLRKYKVGDIPPLDQERSQKIKMAKRGEL